MDRAYNYVTLEPRLQIRDSKDNIVLDFLGNTDLAQKMARTLNLDHWSWSRSSLKLGHGFYVEEER